MKKLLLTISIIWLFSLALFSQQTVSEEEKNLAIDMIEEYSQVKDAAIVQEGDDLSLALIVGYATSERGAKELGENFVRLTKTFIDDEPSPEKRIGEGIYNYTIGVYTPDEERIVLGVKVDFGRSISW